MIVYQADNGSDNKTFGTLAEAHAWCKKTCEGVFRGGCIIVQADVPLVKENILRLLNQEGGTHQYTGRRWKLTARGGIKEVDDPEAEL
ncbi:hypothetical protein [Variovorax paradoxus]|uniref:hypothetical protein n=1 Tax=Variovorax paradoxus TaxID=34073 RepID=UPI002860CCEB|nr:hypothetical protein [Variovorax paradoxus]MDR6455471.1 hypothetical protein [Variovorax paradoxus]